MSSIADQLNSDKIKVTAEQLDADVVENIVKMIEKHNQMLCLMLHYLIKTFQSWRRV